MELTTALSFIAITAATGIAFYFIYRPVRQARRFVKMYNRLNWRNEQ
jgi:hypothetical protein